MSLQEIARDNFATWAESLQSKDPKQVAELYTEDSVFLPTMAPGVKQGKQEAEEYFEHFLKKNPEGEITQERIQPMGEGYYSHSGLYIFKVGSNGKSDIVPARFTFNWRTEPNGKWRIMTHHSSAEPQ